MADREDFAADVAEAINKRAATRAALSDANAIRVPGMHHVVAGATSNMPFSGAGVVLHLPAHIGTSFVQVAYEYGQTLTSFQRYSTTNGATWGAWGKTSYFNQFPPSDVNDCLPGSTSVTPLATPNLPVAGVAAVVQTFPVSSSMIQIATTYETIPRMFSRIRVGATWRAWAGYASSADIGALNGRVTALEDAPPIVSGGGGAGFKIAPLAMTQGAGDAKVTTDQGAVRWARRYAHMPRRVRVHIANSNPYYTTGSGSNGALTLNSVRIGAGSLDGSTTTSIAAHPGGTLAQNGTALVGPWVTIPGVEDGGYLVVSAAWSGGGGTVNIHRLAGGGWTNTSAAAVTDATTSGWTANDGLTPLHCWLEAEVPAAAPVIVGHGDSITCGIGASHAVDMSWLSQYAYQVGAVPVHLASSGSTMERWGAGAPAWTTYGDFDLSIADVVVSTMGQNDLITAPTLATLQARHAAMMTALRSVFPSQPVLLGSITPSQKAPAIEATRRDFNAWRATLPHGERGVIDFATAIGDGEDLLPEYDGDGLHPNTAGAARMAEEAVTAHATPRTLTSGQLSELAALLA